MEVSSSCLLLRRAKQRKGGQHRRRTPAQCSRLPKWSSRSVSHKETEWRVWHCCRLHHIQTRGSAFLQRIQVGLCAGLVLRGEQVGRPEVGRPKAGPWGGLTSHGLGWLFKILGCRGGKECREPDWGVPALWQAAGGPGEGGGCIGQGQWEEVCGGRADALTVQQNSALLAEDWSFADIRHHWRALRSSLFYLTIPVHSVSFPLKLSNSAQNKGHVGRAAYSLSSLELRENPQDQEEQHHCVGPSKPGWTQPSGTLHHIILLIANLCLWGNSRLLEDALHGLLKWGAESCSKGANVHQGASLRQRCGFLPKPDFKERSPGLSSHYYRWSIVRMAQNESTRLLHIRIS